MAMAIEVERAMETLVDVGCYKIGGKTQNELKEMLVELQKKKMFIEQMQEAIRNSEEDVIRKLQEEFEKVFKYSDRCQTIKEEMAKEQIRRTFFDRVDMVFEKLQTLYNSLQLVDRRITIVQNTIR